MKRDVVAIVGDIHGQIDQMYCGILQAESEREIKVKAIIHVGDFGIFLDKSRVDGGQFNWTDYWNKDTIAPIPTYVNMGNHEDPAAIRLWEREPGRVPNIWMLADGTISNICGLQIGAIWGNYSPRSYENPDRVNAARSGEMNSPRIAMHINRYAIDHMLRSPDKMDVLITHDSAVCTLPEKFKHKQIDPVIKQILGLQQDEQAGGCPGIDLILQKFIPSSYYYGHLHEFNCGFAYGTIWKGLSSLGYGRQWYDFIPTGE